MHWFGRGFKRAFAVLLWVTRGDVAPVGEGVSELRLHFGAGWRVYFTEVDAQITVLLAGGSKGTQKRDIATALELARNL